MGSFFQRKSVRYCLSVFKWCRVTVLFAIFLVVAAVAYLQFVGLPDFLKGPLLRALRQRGFDAQFSSARLGWGPSIIIENASFSPTNQSAGPRLSAERTQLNLNANAFLHARLQVDSFEIRRASLSIPVAPTNQEPLSLMDVNLRVLLATNDVAVLNDCSAWSRGIRIRLNGQVRDFLALRDWKIFRRPSVAPAARPPSAAGPTNAVASAPRPTAWEIFQEIRFAGTPQLDLNFYADGHDQNTLRAELQFTATGTQTPWGQSGPLQMRAACARVFNPGNAPFCDVNLQAGNVATPWGQSRDFAASLELSRAAGTNFSALVHLAGHQLSTDWNSPSGSNWVRVTDLQWDGSAALPSPAYMPDSLQGTLRASNTESGWGSIGSASLVLQTRRSSNASPADPGWGPWNQIKPFALDWQADATNILTPKLKLERVAFKGGWHPPQLTIDTLEAFMYRGHLNAGGGLNVASREVQARASVDFDPHQLSPLLTGPAQHWISLYDWDAPPNLSGGIRFVLPPWTNRMDIWPEDSRNSLQLAGDFSIGRGAFRGIAVNSAKSHYTYTNQVWNVTGLRVAGDGGSLELDYTWNDLTDDYHFRFDSKLDPAIALPLLTPPQQRTLRAIIFSDKPELWGEVWGNWTNPATTGFAATLSTSRFLVRGEKLDQLSAQLDYTNRFLRVGQLHLVRDTGEVKVPLAGIDFASHVISLTNGSSTIDPEAVRRALGPVAPPFMREVHFDSPPLVRASGSFTPGNDDGTDMHFSVQGDRFHWGRIGADSAQGTVDYHVRTVVVTNVEAAIYKTGKLHGWITFEWDRRGTEFDSVFNLNDINLAALAREWVPKNSTIEGTLDGHLALAAPFGARETNFYGSGWLHVHNGLLWDIKLFGVFSPILNAIAPGSGNSRAREASASFVITNGVLTTDDLDIRSSGFRLLYRGTIDTRQRLDARVEAKLLRDTPVFGHLFSWMLLPLDKLFEYRVTGTLRKPVAEPQYIPKVFTEILRPFHTLKTMRRPKADQADSPPAPPAGQPQN
jgi:hypothetical protein